jgi:hypothetical protein
MTRDFAPDWKWLPVEFRKRREAQPHVSLLEELVSIRETERQVEIVLSLCSLVHQQLLDGGWVTGQNRSPYLLPLHGDKIELEGLSRDG